MTTQRLGLHDGYHHYFDKFGNKYYDSTAWYAIPFIRQIQTVDGRMIDASDGKPFCELADSLGLIISERGLYEVYENKHVLLPEWGKW